MLAARLAARWPAMVENVQNGPTDTDLSPHSQDEAAICCALVAIQIE